MVKKRCDPARGQRARERAPRHRKLSQAIAQSGWGMFLNFLDYKLKHKGGVLVDIDRFFPSSKLCSNCGHKYEELQLHEREWTCKVCNKKHSRDYMEYKERTTTTA